VDIAPSTPTPVSSIRALRRVLLLTRSRARVTTSIGARTTPARSVRAVKVARSSAHQYDGEDLVYDQVNQRSRNPAYPIRMTSTAANTGIPR